MNLGVIVPCRNEAGVVQRKLANLLLARWPAGAHRILVVDDGSDDGTPGRAAAALEQLAGRPQVRVEVLANANTPGKPGAIATGLAVLQASGSAQDRSPVEIVILTDADVIVEAGALEALAQAFSEGPELAMASGAQLFVQSLDEGGAFRASGGAAFDEAGGLYDSTTAWIRRLESRAGMLFSVHGQLLAWRLSLGLVPARGLAADDLDLRLQVRARAEQPRRVELVPEALFAELKELENRDAQALRRARAYVQTIVRREPPALAPLDRVQLALYRRLPVLAPWVLLGLIVAAPALAGWFGGPRLLTAALLGELALLALPCVRRLARLCAWIVRAERAERRAPMGDRWEMARR